MAGFYGRTYGRRSSDAYNVLFSRSTTVLGSPSFGSGGREISAWENEERSLLNALLVAQTEVIEKFQAELLVSEKERAKLAEKTVALSTRLDRMKRRTSMTGGDLANNRFAIEASPIGDVKPHRRSSGRFLPQQQGNKSQSEFAASATNSMKRAKSPVGSVTGQAIDQPADVIPTPGWSKVKKEKRGKSVRTAGKMLEDLSDEAFKRRHDKFQLREQRVHKQFLQSLRDRERIRKQAERAGRKSSNLSQSRGPSSSSDASNGDPTLVNDPMKVDLQEIEEIFIGDDPLYKLCEGNILKKIGRRGRPPRTEYEYSPLE